MTFAANTYNNELKYNDNTNFIRNVNNALRNNRRILNDPLADEEKITLLKSLLTQAGFNFKYATHTYTNKKEAVYFFCYEYDYMHLENDRCLIVKRLER